MTEMKKEKEKKHFHGHRERLRDRFRDNPDSLCDYECLELLLGYAIPRGDTKPLAKALLDETKGKLYPILDDPELSTAKHLTEYQRTLLTLTRHLMSRALKENLLSSDALNVPETVATFVKTLLMESPNERFLVLYLNSKNNVMSHEFHSEGTLGTTAVYPRRIVESALENRAAALILAHNHPSGDPDPSAEDVRLTRQIIAAADLLSIRVLDHIIIGRNTYYSMRREGDI